jgi:hypothetical protein
MPTTSTLFFGRGNTCNNGSGAGPYHFSNDYGGGDGYIGFRPVLLVGSEL